MEVSSPFVSDLFDLVIADLLVNSKEVCKKSKRWERYLFSDWQEGEVVFRGLMGQVLIPTRKHRGYEHFVSGVYEIAYCRDEGVVRVRCALAQEAVSQYPMMV